MPEPLIANPDDFNELDLISGQFYTYIHPSAKGEPIWKHPKYHTGDVSMDILGHIPYGKPFLFTKVEKVASTTLSGAKRYWIQVIYLDIIGFVKVSGFHLHEILKLVTSEV
jgi:hypothetical protein